MSERRKADFKKGVDRDDARRRRSETSVRIRKSKREEGLQKRRARMDGLLEPTAETPAGPGMAAQVPGRPISVEDLPVYARDLASTDQNVVREATRAIRKLLSVSEMPPVIELVQAGALPHLVSFLSRLDDPDLVFEAAWALTNVASTSYTNVVVDGGAVPGLVALLMHEQPNVREQAAWCLGNIAGDSPPLRDAVLQAGAMEPVLANISQPATVGMLKNVVWALSNFCRGKPQPPLEALAPAVPMLLHCMLAHPSEVDVLMDAAWALSYVCDGEEERIEAVVASGAVPYLVQGVGHADNKVVVPALRSLGNIVSGTHAQTQMVVDAGVLVAAPGLLRSAKRNVRKEACWMLSNVAAGTSEQVAALVQAPEVLKLVIELMGGHSSFEVRKEAAWVVSNVANGACVAHLQLLAELGSVAQLCDLLEANDPKLVSIVVDTLEHMLRDAQSRASNHVELLVDECGGIETLEALQEHQDEDIYKKVVTMIELYFSGADDDEEDENLAPRVDPQNANAFAFGLDAGNAGKMVFDFGSAEPAPTAFGQL